MYKGEVIARSDLELVAVKNTETFTVFTDFNNLIGKKVTTNLEHLIKEDMDNSGNNKYDVNKTPRNEIFSLEHINHLSTNVEANDSSEENV